VFNRLFAVLPAILCAAVWLGGSTGPGLAQDEAMISLGKQMWTERFPCRNCHGGMADGVGDVPQEEGPSLRNADYLTPDILAELIRCGRPGTGMPYFDSRGYSDGKCYGLAADDPAVPPHGSPNATSRSVNALVAFIMANFVGKGAPTHEECVAIWSETAPVCARFD
jgi:hypothetical protein